MSQSMTTPAPTTPPSQLKADAPVNAHQHESKHGEHQGHSVIEKIEDFLTGNNHKQSEGKSAADVAIEAQRMTYTPLEIEGKPAPHEAHGGYNAYGSDLPNSEVREPEVRHHETHKHQEEKPTADVANDAQAMVNESYPAAGPGESTFSAKAL